MEEAAERIQKKGSILRERQEKRIAGENLGTVSYDKAVAAVVRQIRELRFIFEQQEAKDKEREWLPNQSQGELDDSRLVDGASGEKLIYRRRAEPDLPIGYQQKKPKAISFVVDVSASMYRFNSDDGRMDRMLQAVAMVMESLEGFEHKYTWNIVGHSGDGPEHKFVDFATPPRSRKQRAEILNKISNASAMAWSGDSTVEGIEAAIKSVCKQDAEDYLVFAISDANLGSYGITPENLRQVLTSDPKVTSCGIFIAERSAAEMLSKALPPGRGHTCFDVTQLPNILKEVFQRAAANI